MGCWVGCSVDFGLCVGFCGLWMSCDVLYCYWCGSWNWRVSGYWILWNWWCCVVLFVGLVCVVIWLYFCEFCVKCCLVVLIVLRMGCGWFWLWGWVVLWWLFWFVRLFGIDCCGLWMLVLVVVWLICCFCWFWFGWYSVWKFWNGGLICGVIGCSVCVRSVGGYLVYLEMWFWNMVVWCSFLVVFCL